MPNALDEASEDFVSLAILLDKDNQPLATVQATISPRLRSLHFRLQSLEQAHQILATAASLQATDHSRWFRLTNAQICSGVHQDKPEMPHVTASFESLD